MNIATRLAERGIDEAKLRLAIVNTEKVLATVILNSSKNVTNAQAMKGNASDLAGDLKVLEEILEDMTGGDDDSLTPDEEAEIMAALEKEEADAAEPKKTRKPRSKPLTEAETTPEAPASEEDNS